MSRLRWMGLAFCLLLVACGSSPPSSPPAPPAAVPAHAEARDGRFLLVFDLPKDTYASGEPIDGVATLSVDGGAGVPFGASGTGVIVMQFAEVGGPRAMAAAMSADCRPGLLIPGTPIVSPMNKAGAYVGDDPLAPFYKSFLDDPVYRLPAGEWRLTALASFVEQDDCGGAGHELTATVTVHVLP